MLEDQSLQEDATMFPEEDETFLKPVETTAAQRLLETHPSCRPGENQLTGPTDGMLKQRELKDAELDKKIEALRKKNEALMKRYQEVEEDKKKAEQEGMALQSRKGKAEDLTITINKSTSEARVVMKKPSSGGSASSSGVQEPTEGDLNPFGIGRGKRRQLLVTTGGNTRGKRVVSENRVRGHPPNLGTPRDMARQEGGDVELDRVYTRSQEDEARAEQSNLMEDGGQPTELDPYYENTGGPGWGCHADLSVPTSREEQLEYLRWKKEREQIDRERVARHKNAKGQWRRAWDVDKPEIEFREKSHGEGERGNQSRGGRNPRRGNPRYHTELKGHMGRNKHKGGKSPPTISSRAQGKDRLTGRARRWDSKEDEDPTQTNLEEFLEGLDNLGDPEVDDTPLEVEGKDVGQREEAQDKGSTEEAVNAGNSEELTASRVSSQGGGKPDMGSSPETSNQGGGKPDMGSSPEASNQGGGKPDMGSSPEISNQGGGKSDMGSSPEASNQGGGKPDMGSSPEISNQGGGKSDMGSSPEASNQGGGKPDMGATPEATRLEALPLRAPEKKVRFSADTVEKSESQSSTLEVRVAEVGGGHAHTPAPPCWIQTDSNSRGSGQEPEHRTRPAGSTEENQHPKSSGGRSPEEMIDSSLSVLPVTSAAPHTANKTSTDKAKENGKIV